MSIGIIIIFFCLQRLMKNKFVLCSPSNEEKERANVIFFVMKKDFSHLNEGCLMAKLEKEF